MSKLMLFLIVSVNILIISCHSLDNVIELNTNLEYFENIKHSILFETKPGCVKTNFNFTEDYYKLNIRNNNCFTATSFEEYENKILKYFEMDYFDLIDKEFFNNFILLVIILSADDDEYYKNGKFYQNEDNNLVYRIELWNNGKPFFLRNKCSYFKTFIINIENNNL